MSSFRRSFLTLGAALTLALSACGGAAPASPTAAPAPAAPTAAAPAAAAPAASAPTAAPAAAAPAAPAAAAPTAAAPAKVIEYNVTVITDKTGPGAEGAKGLDVGRKVAFTWWNETRGKELGIKLNATFYDGRYDSSQVATIWTTALASAKPVFVAGYGGPDVAALQERLPNDKVPLYLGGFSQGYAWLPNQWVFFVQATATHNLAGFLNWKVANWKENRPIRVGQLMFQAASAQDQVSGLASILAKGLFAGKVEFAGVEYNPPTSPDVANVAKKLVDSKADYVHSLMGASTDVAFIRAVAQLKSNLKVILPSGQGITQLAALLPLAELEGTIESYAFNSELDTAADAYKVFQEYKGKAGVGEAVWEHGVIWGMANIVPALRAVERASAAVGVDKITGESVYNAMFSSPLTTKEMLGITRDLAYTKAAPFPTKDVRVRISTVTNGKYTLATPDWVAVPEISKW